MDHGDLLVGNLGSTMSGGSSSVIFSAGPSVGKTTYVNGLITKPSRLQHSLPRETGRPALAGSR